jgi:hypothetical protein
VWSQRPPGSDDVLWLLSFWAKWVSNMFCMVLGAWEVGGDEALDDHLSRYCAVADEKLQT